MLFPSQFFVYNYTKVLIAKFFQYGYRLHLFQRIMHLHVYLWLTHILF